MPGQHTGEGGADCLQGEHPQRVQPQRLAVQVARDRGLWFRYAACEYSLIKPPRIFRRVIVRLGCRSHEGELLVRPA
jgi:hypothetical protein